MNEWREGVVCYWLCWRNLGKEKTHTHTQWFSKTRLNFSAPSQFFFLSLSLALHHSGTFEVEWESSIRSHPRVFHSFLPINRANSREWEMHCHHLPSIFMDHNIRANFRLVFPIKHDLMRDDDRRVKLSIIIRPFATQYFSGISYKHATFKKKCISWKACPFFEGNKTENWLKYLLWIMCGVTAPINLIQEVSNFFFARYKLSTFRQYSYSSLFF